ncbi:MAG: cysteine--tRNA ligase [bacterium]|nr:cysteine--tRNA ligase [bacterium]
MKIYNTLTRKKEDFTPLVEGKVGMYVCGPTVYNHIHVGNARTFVSFDVIRRHLINSGYDVTFVSNITDVDDKIINRANEEGRTAAEVAEEYSNAFIKAMDDLGVMPPTIRPYATKEIDAMIGTIETLIANGHAYEAEGDVYFSIKTFPEYGKLSGRTVDELLSGTRFDVDPKKHDPLDFALWKAAKPGEPYWECPWGKGRPGWHIECSSMSAKYLGQPFDIHGGGVDLVFPHHENEIAQSECCSNVTFCNYWMHGGMLLIDNEKMSKSLNNFLLLKDVLANLDARVLRFLMLQTHYRSPMDYSKQRLDEAANSFERIANTLRNIDWEVEHADLFAEVDVAAIEKLDVAVAAGVDSYVAYMDDDFNTAAALGEVFSIVGAVNGFIADGLSGAEEVKAAQAAHDAIVDLMGRFGIDMAEESDETAGWPAELLAFAKDVAGYEGDDMLAAGEAIISKRAEARKAKDWGTADAIRDGLSAMGFAVEDTAAGSRLSYGG